MCILYVAKYKIIILLVQSIICAFDVCIKAIVLSNQSHLIQYSCDHRYIR